jgi:hypothetical protein
MSSSGLASKLMRNSSIHANLSIIPAIYHPRKWYEFSFAGNVMKLEEKVKDQFYEQLEQTYSACPKNDVQLVMGDANA